MSNPLAEYLSALDARDARERAHEVYITACKYNSLKACSNTLTGLLQTPSLPTALLHKHSSMHL